MLNVPALAGPERSQAELQHVAFACGDALAAAGGMRERGEKSFQVPDNYYEGEAARHTLDAGLLDAMRELGVLCGPLPPTASSCISTARPSRGRVFFEVLEQRGRYDGYGAANSPVRMAAQQLAITARAAPAPFATERDERARSRTHSLRPGSCSECGRSVRK